MQTYCLSCRKHTEKIGPRKVIITNKVVRQTSSCANCVAKKLIFSKNKSSKKNWLEQD